MTIKFAISACRNILSLWASTFELQLSCLQFPTESTVEFSINTSESLPVFAISQLQAFLGPDIVVKASISKGGLSMTITIKNYQNGRVAYLWKIHEHYFGR